MSLAFQAPPQWEQCLWARTRSHQHQLFEQRGHAIHGRRPGAGVPRRGKAVGPLVVVALAGLTSSSVKMLKWAAAGAGDAAGAGTAEGAATGAGEAAAAATGAPPAAAAGPPGDVVGMNMLPCGFRNGVDSEGPTGVAAAALGAGGASADSGSQSGSSKTRGAVGIAGCTKQGSFSLT